ncbi:MAG TPA: HAD hydrolase family protein, partial [Petrotogaceae bacterium]|nr:HAD hydrolase family protein [Petrotogaceae bacterium]
VFGDSQNDISMLQLTENSFAMGNSTENVKNVCKYIIPTNDEEGVAQILEKILDSSDIDTFCNSRYSSRN